MSTYQDAPAWPKFENLRNFKETGEGKFKASCPGPSHTDGDSNPSLGIVIGKKQQIIPTCFKDCTFEEILAGVGCRAKDLYPPTGSAKPQRDFRLEDAVAVYDYTDESDAILFKVGRFEPKDFRPFSPAGPRWKLGEKGIRRHVPYHLSKLKAAPMDEVILVLEGEEDAERAERVGFTATTTHGGAQGLAKSAQELAAAVTGRKVAIIPDADTPGDKYATAVSKAITESASSVVIVNLPGLTHRKEHGQDLSDWLDQGHPAGELYSLIAEAIPVDFAQSSDAHDGHDAHDGPAADPSDDDAEKPDKGPSQSALLVRLTEELRVEFFHTPENAPYAYVLRDGHRETWPLRGSGFSRWLRHQYYERTGKVPSANAVNEAMGVLEGKALFQGDQHKVWMRVAKHDGALYLDLANDAWQVIKITATGYELVSAAPVRFRRAEGMYALPLPVTGGSLDDLRPFVNVSDEDWLLLQVWILALFRPEVPLTVLQLHDGQGRAKSSTARAARSTIDPSALPIRTPPREERDLAIAAKNTWVLAYDNISHIQQWLSDAMSRLSTGGGSAVRSLYTDDDQTIFSAIRPQVITGIEEVVTEGDLLDRTLMLTLPEIPGDKRLEEEELWPAFDKAHPAILGALLDAVSGILRHLPNVKIAEKPRMADFARWGVATEMALGWERGSFMKAYMRQRADSDAVAREASPVAGTLIAWWESWQVANPSAEKWEGPASELLALLEAKADENTKRHRGWPKNPRALSGSLSRIAPNVISAGVNIIKLDRVGNSRPWRIEKAAAVPSRPSFASSNGASAEFKRADGDDGRPTPGTDRHNDRHYPDAFEFPADDGHDGHDGATAAHSGGVWPAPAVRIGALDIRCACGLDDWYNTSAGECRCYVCDRLLPGSQVGTAEVSDTLAIQEAS